VSEGLELLDESLLATVIDIAEITIEDSDYRGLLMLACLTAGQKKQIWDNLSRDDRSALRALERESTYA
jgi:hypothetical protein